MALDRSSRRVGFTLIELLVVVAIIALLISILLPSLSKARAQARSSLCASRISQLCKAVLVYADDYEETPPFIGRGWEDCQNLPSGEWPTGSGITVEELARLEAWLMPDMPRFWLTAESTGWPADADVRNGTLFSYARFANLYRCPEFERISSPLKSQNVFNYTRSMLGRKWFDLNDPEGQPGSPWKAEYGGPFGAPGPIMRTAQVYAPSRMYMLLDERWRAHCAAPEDELGGPAGEGLIEDQLSGMWLAIDTCWTIGDEGGRYHGAKRIADDFIPPEVAHRIEPIKQGNASFYDGHVGLHIDPLPDRLIGTDWGMDQLIVGGAFVEWLRGMIFTQRGKAEINIDLQ